MSTLKVNQVTDLAGDTPDGVGRILQVVQAVETGIFAQTLSPGVVSDAVFSASITPSSASSKVLVQASLVATASTAGVHSILFRNNAVLTSATGDVAGDRKPVTTGSASIANDRIMANQTFTFLDSPSTDSSVTYDVRLHHVSAAGPQSVFLNRTATNDDNSSSGRGISTITLMEVAG